jgi:PadR family transcriptional regulator, regulatory protein PadR
MPARTGRLPRTRSERRHQPVSIIADRWRYGYDLGTEVHLKSGSLYPILVRLADRGLLEASWEPGVDSRPPRHLYRLSTAGREYVAALSADRVDRPTPHRLGHWSVA